MNTELINLKELGVPEEELFTLVTHRDEDSEKITAPRYSYWQSVFRVFFKKRINIIVLGLLAVIIIFAYVYPSLISYDRYANLNDSTAKHLMPIAAMQKFGGGLSWILGAGASGEPTFDTIWVGSRISISLALMCALINMTIGILLGAVWGFSKKIDIFMTEVYNIIGNVPYILLISVLVMTLSASFWTMVFALTVTGWLGIAYFIRTQYTSHIEQRNDCQYNTGNHCCPAFIHDKSSPDGYNKNIFRGAAISNYFRVSTYI